LKGGLEMKKCEDLRELISLYIDGELSGDLLFEFEEHILSCENCKNELEDVKSVIASLNDAPEEDLPSNFKDDLHEKLIKEKSKKESFISIVLTKYSHVFASAAGILIIFSIWLVYKNNFVSTDSSMPKVSSIQSYDSKEYENKENAVAKGEFDLNTVDGQDQTNFEFNKKEKNIVNDGLSGTTQDQRIIDSTGSPTTMFNDAQQNGKLGSAFTEPVREGNGDLTFGRSGGNVSTPKAKSTPAPTTEEKVFLTLDDTGSKSADFTLNASDTEAKREELRKIAVSLGGEEYGNIAITSSEAISAKAVAPKASYSMEASQNNGTMLNFRIPENNYNIFLQKVNETFGASNVKTNGVVNTDNAKREKEIEAEIADIDKKLSSNANNSTCNQSSEYNTLIDNKNNLNRELDEIKNNSKYITVKIIIQKT
jgi:hypothetical protein